MLIGALALIVILGLASMASADMCPPVLQAQFCVDGDDSCDENLADNSFLHGNSLYVSNFYYLMKIDLLTNSIEWMKTLQGARISSSIFV